MSKLDYFLAKRPLTKDVECGDTGIIKEFGNKVFIGIIDVLVLYTDGVKEHFGLEDYPELLKDKAETIATHIIHQFGKENDDAACIALRYGND